MTAKLELSIMMGTRAMSGSAAMRLRKWVMASTESSSPSSMFTSMMLAPPSTCWRAISTAASYSPFRIRRAKRCEPVMLVRSPIMVKLASGRRTSGSMPL